jgi:hypothetical protein
MRRFFTPFTCLLLLLLALVSSCQKDESVKDMSADNIALKTDSVKKLGVVSSAGNYLAVKGTLTVKVLDSIYTFDASKDSVAFINMMVDGSQYYGVTAINKAHTISFGISSQGSPIAATTGSVAGCQFLLNVADKPNMQYTLTHNSPLKDFGAVTMEKYNQETELAKGTFYTYLTGGLKANDPFFKTEGSFDLQLK